MRGKLREYGEVLAVIAAVTIGGRFVPLNFRALGHVYLIAVIALSLRVSMWPALLAAVSSSLAWNYVYLPPRFSFTILNAQDGLLLGTYVVAALIATGKISSLRSAHERARLLTESERLHRTLLDSVSHELKTPIAVLRSAGEQLGTDDLSKRQRLTFEIRTAVRRLDDLVANLLNQTRLESGVLNLHMDWCDPRDIVAAAQRSLGDRLEGRPVKIEIPPETPLFFADAVLMEQSVANLILNAAVHSPPGGTISVAAGTIGRPPRVFISVSDEGPGIAPEFWDKIFDKFQRGPDAPPGGLGLGLSIVRGFMLAQGGEASYLPLTKGSRFAVYLPQRSQEKVPNE